MADVSTDDIAGYSAYLKSKGTPDSEIQGYTKYLADQHDVDHPDDRGMLGKAFGALDSVTVAPVLSGISAAQHGKNPFSAAWNQFGSDNRTAPTGEQIAANAGASTQPTVDTAAAQQAFDEKYNPARAMSAKQAGIPYQDVTRMSQAKALGIPIEMAANPVNYLPVEAIGKTAVGALGEGAASIKNAFSLSQAQEAESAANAASGASVTIKGGGSSVEQGGQMFSFKPPQSLDELRAWKPEGDNGALLGKQRLAEIQQQVPDLKVQPLKYHYDMMENPKAMKALKLQFENLPTKDAQKLASYNQGMVDESANKLKQTVSDLGGSEPKTMSNAGNDLISTVKDKYNAEKDALGPVFQKIQSGASDLNRADTSDLIQAIGNNTKAGKLLQQDPQTGIFSLGENSPRSGLGNDEHKAISSVIDDLNKGMNFKEVQNTRDYLNKLIDPANPRATAEISKTRGVLLDQLGQMADKAGPDVGQTFKSYAVNERARENVEKVIGGKIDSLDSMYAANPDKVVQKVFSNPNYAKAVRDYVGPEKMNELASSYIQNGLNKSMDSAKGFAPSTFKNWMKANSNFLQSNVPGPVVDRLNALADYGYYGKRFLDEVNPSGTAASLEAMIKPGSFMQRVEQHGIVGAISSQASSAAHAVVGQRSAIKAVNEMLGAEPKANSLVAAVKSLPPAQSTRAALSAGQASNALTADNPTKGPEKWASDGADKLIEHSPEDKAAIEKLRGASNDPQVKQLLIQASDLRPNTPAMDKILSKIKSKLASGD